MLRSSIMQRNPRLFGTKPPDKLRQAAVRLEHEMGSTGAARELGLGRETFARIVAGLGVRPGSIALAEKHLARLESPARKATSKSSAA
jgi:hypothetical protein